MLTFIIISSCPFLFLSYISWWLCLHNQSKANCPRFSVCPALYGVCVYAMWGEQGGFIKRCLWSCCSICKVWSVIIPSHYCDLKGWDWGARWDPLDNTVTPSCGEHQYLNRQLYTAHNSPYLEAPASWQRLPENILKSAPYGPHGLGKNKLRYKSINVHIFCVYTSTCTPFQD